LARNDAARHRRRHGTFATAFSDWFGAHVVAVEPSDAMREHIPHTPAIEVRKGDASTLPLADASADAAWMSLVLHHIPDLDAAAREIRRVLHDGAPILIRGGFSGGDYSGIELVRWFPETARTVDTFPSLDETLAAFASAGLHQVALEPVWEARPSSLASFLAEIDDFRRADTTLRGLTNDEFMRGKERLRRAVDAGSPDARTNTLDLLVLA
jgi:SAM-dependent methyltransferase